MKHIFYLHSALNYVIAKRIIDVLKLQPNDCIFLYDRIQPFSNESIIQDFFPHFPLPASQSYSLKFLFWNQWSSIKKFDKKIGEFTNGNPFYFYALFSWGNFFYLTISHSLCRGYYYMEDGTISLNPINHVQATIPLKEKNKKWLRKLLYFLNFPFRDVPFKKEFYDITNPKFKGFFASCKEIFPDYPQKQVIGIKTIEKPQYASYEHILVLDGVADFGYVSQENYIKAIKMLPDWFIKKNIKKVYIKYQKPHSGNEPIINELKLFFESFSGQIVFSELTQDIILEEIAFNSNANFYINVSSIGFYAYLAGRNVFTWIRFVQYFEDKFTINSIQPEAFIKSLGYMNLS